MPNYLFNIDKTAVMILKGVEVISVEQDILRDLNVFGKDWSTAQPQCLFYK